MAVDTTTSYQEFAADGTTAYFTFNFNYNTNRSQDIVVGRRTGDDTYEVVGAENYELIPNPAGNGGQVRFIQNPTGSQVEDWVQPEGTVIRISRVSLDTSDATWQIGLEMSSLITLFDRLFRLVQENKGGFDNTIRTFETQHGVSLFEMLAAHNNRLLFWNNNDKTITPTDFPKEDVVRAVNGLFFRISTNEEGVHYLEWSANGESDWSGINITAIESVATEARDIAEEARDIANDAKDIAQEASESVGQFDARITQAEQNANQAKTIATDASTAVNNHITNYNNPHQVTKAQVGLGNVDNTSDLAKPISTATQAALDGKQNTISDLATIRSGAALGATAVQPSDLGDGTITITQGGVTKGTFTTNQSGNTTIDVDAGGGSGLPDQTGQSGKFLTTDGTDASWSDKPLVNTATGTNGIGIGGSSLVASGNNSIAVGPNPQATATGAIAIGVDARATVADGIAIGDYARSTANKAYQIGGGINGTANSFQVGSHQLLNLSDGTIPEARLADTTNAQQGDVLTLDSTGNAVWQAGGGSVTGQSIDAEIVGTLTVASNGDVSGLDNSNYLVYPGALDMSSASSFEMVFSFTTANAVSTAYVLNGVGMGYNSEHDIAIAINSSEKLWFYVNASSDTITGTTTIQPNTKYYVKVVYDGTDYILSLSADGNNWNTEGSVSATEKPGPLRERKYAIGRSVSSVFSVMHLKECYIKENNILVWQGMDAPGLHQRIDTNVSNVSALGKLNIIDMVMPDYANSVDITLNTSSTYTAQRNGYIVFNGTSNGTVGLAVNNVSVTQASWSGGKTIGIWCMVAKGDVVSILSTSGQSIAVNQAKFIPCKGA